MSVESRRMILANLRMQSTGSSAPLPEVIQGNWIEYADPVAQLTSVIESVGGLCEVVQSENQIQERLLQYDRYRDAKRVYSKVSAIPGNVDIDKVESPKDLDDLDFVIYRGEFAVSENGAIWVTDRELKHRVIFFITQHLVMVLPKSAIVPTMHHAYSKIDIAQQSFGLFLSGPSKTADIEQSLVIGAHGCRSLQVYLLEQ